MDELTQALEGFLIGAIPTIILFLMLWWLYDKLVHVPLRRTLDERRNRTEGALARARADLTTAEAKTHEYEQRIRDAKLAIFKAQEARRQQLASMREALMAEARKQAQGMIAGATASLEKEVAQGRASLQQQGEALAGEVIRAVLRPMAAAGGRG